MIKLVANFFFGCCRKKTKNGIFHNLSLNFFRMISFFTYFNILIFFWKFIFRRKQVQQKRNSLTFYSKHIFSERKKSDKNTHKKYVQVFICELVA